MPNINFRQTALNYTVITDVHNTEPSDWSEQFPTYNDTRTPIYF